MKPVKVIIVKDLNQYSEYIDRVILEDKYSDYPAPRDAQFDIVTVSDDLLDTMLDTLLIKRGEHPTRVRNPLYGEERKLAKNLVKKLLIHNGS